MNRFTMCTELVEIKKATVSFREKQNHRNHKRDKHHIQIHQHQIQLC